MQTEPTIAVIDIVDDLRKREYLASIRPGAVRNLPGGLEVVYNDDSRCAELTHAAGSRQASFDLTTFNSRRERGGHAGRERFIELLERHEIDPVEGYVRVAAYPDSDREYVRYVWANDRVALITGNNPVTGEYREPDARPPEPGYASYMGLEGDGEAVSALFADVESSAAYVKGANNAEREFI